MRLAVATHITILFKGFDEAFGAGGFQLRDEVADGAFFEDRVELRSPV
jgi:hypothetical protein